MNLIEALILGALQGITEFLPISSSGHLVLGQEILGLEVDLLKNFDVAVHVASLLAIFVYFRRDLLGMLRAFFNLFRGRVDKEDPYGKLTVYIVIATIPVALIGAFYGDWIDAQFRSAGGVAVAMIVTGFVFITGEFVYKYIHNSMPVKSRLAEKFLNCFEKLADWFKPGGYQRQRLQEINLSGSIIIGLAQTAALIPGVSRSGATIVAGIFQGVERSTAARFSFLLAMPAIAGAGVLTVFKNGEDIFISSAGASLWALVFGFLASFIFSFLSIGFLMRFFRRFSLNIFAVYLIVLGLWTYF